MRVSLSVAIVAGLLVGAGVALASPKPLPLRDRLIKQGEFAGLRTESTTHSFKTAKAWVANGPHPSAAQMSAEVARLHREGFVAVLSEFLDRLNLGARVVICGTASIASWDPPPQGPRVERHLLVKRARMQGFLIFDHVQRSPEAVRELESWVRNGQIRYREDILDGIEQAPGSIAGLYRGENLGKRLIRIAPDVPPPHTRAGDDSLASSA